MAAQGEDAHVEKRYTRLIREEFVYIRSQCLVRLPWRLCLVGFLARRCSSVCKSREEICSIQAWNSPGEARINVGQFLYLMGYLDVAFLVVISSVALLLRK
jgi:hypothetical protein